MGTQATSGYGTTLAYSPLGSTPVYTAVAELLDTKGPGLKTKAIKATNNTTSAGTEEYIPSGVVDGGQIELEVNYVPSEHNTIAGLVDTLQMWQITFPTKPTAHTCSFNGILEEFEVNSPLEEKMTASLKIQVTGAVTFT